MNMNRHSRARGRRAAFTLAALYFLACAAPPACAVSLESVTPPPDTHAVYEAIERGRQALLADKYVDAAKAMDEALQRPEFAALPKSDQFRAFLFAAYAAQGKEDYLGAHEFAVIASQYPDATADTWIMRARYASWVDAWGDAGTAITTLAQRWPKSLSELNDRTVGRVVQQMGEDKKLASERLALLNALFAAEYTHEWGTEPSDIWRELVLDALQRKDDKRALEVLRRINVPNTLIRMRTDRRFDTLVQAEPKAFDVSAAAQAQRKRWRRVMDSNPRKLDPIVQYMYALFTVGGYEEVLALADRTLAKNAKGTKEKPAFDDVEDELNWIYDLKSYALRGLGRWDEALAVQQTARAQRDTSTDKVSQAINLGASYLLRGRPDDALKSLEGIDWANSLSGYGRMQFQGVRLDAYLQLGNREEAEKVFVYMRENKNDAPDTWQEAMLEWGDIEGAAAQYIARLRDPEERPAALYAAQSFQQVPRLPKEVEGHVRWEALLQRKDVAAVINEVGRRELQPIYDLWN